MSQRVRVEAASKAARKREEEAKKLFLAAKKTFEVETLPNIVEDGSPYTIHLLSPNIHLTSTTWGSFNRWVKKQPGWKAKRHEATQEEKEELEAPTKGQSYWVDVIYTVSDGPIKKTRKSPVHKKRNSNSNVDPSAKKQKTNPEPPKKSIKTKRNNETPKVRVGPFNFGGLSGLLQERVLSFVNVPTLGACVFVSKVMNRVASSDSVWSGHLRHLLQMLYDGAFQYPTKTNKKNRIVLISERPQKSTAFFYWLKQSDHLCRITRFLNALHLDSIEDFTECPESYEGQADRYQWLLEDVSLKEYYKQAGAWAYDGQQQHEQFCEQVSRCLHCYYKEWDCQCKHFKEVVYPFGVMPKIRLFYCGL